MVEMNIRDQRDRHGGLDLRKRGGGLIIRNGDSNDFTSGLFQLTNLGHRGRHITRVFKSEVNEMKIEDEQRKRADDAKATGSAIADDTTPRTDNQSGPTL